MFYKSFQNLIETKKYFFLFVRKKFHVIALIRLVNISFAKERFVNERNFFIVKEQNFFQLQFARLLLRDRSVQKVHV